MSFFEDTNALFVVATIASGLGLIALVSLSAYFSSKLPSHVADFWYLNGGAGKNEPKVIVLIALPVLALIIMVVQGLLTQPSIVTLTKAPSGFWMRIAVSVIAPLVHFWILSHHAKIKVDGRSV